MGEVLYSATAILIGIYFRLERYILIDTVVQNCLLSIKIKSIYLRNTLAPLQVEGKAV